MGVAKVGGHFPKWFEKPFSNYFGEGILLQKETSLQEK